MIRETKETRVEVLWNPQGQGSVSIASGIGFLDHIIGQWAFHGGFDLILKAEGDLHVDAHHTVEDVAIALGREIDALLQDRSGLSRFGYAYAPLDEALSRVVVDLVKRPHCSFRAHALPDMLGQLPGEMVPHFFRSLAHEGRFTLHVDILQGDNAHHRVESAFKAFGLAFAQAVQPGGRDAASTKGTM